MLHDKRKLLVEVCKLKNNFHMLILMRMQMINPNIDQTPRLEQKSLNGPESECKDGGDTFINARLHVTVCVTVTIRSGLSQ